MGVKRFEVFWTTLDPTVGSEIRKTRPCVIVSPDEANIKNPTVIIAPFTTKVKTYPTTVKTHFLGKDNYILLDQIRSIDKSLLKQKLGILNPDTQLETLAVLQEMFEE